LPSTSRIVLVETESGDRLSGRLEVLSARGTASEPLAGAQPPRSAIEWARGVADVVVVQSGALRMNAGRVEEPGLIPWAGAEFRAGRHWYEPPGPVRELYAIRVEADGGPIPPSVSERLRATAAVARIEASGPSSIDVVVRRSVVAASADETLDEYVAALVATDDERLVEAEADFEMDGDGRWVADDGSPAPVSLRCFVLGPVDDISP
jgi:hypothetical protein